MVGSLAKGFKKGTKDALKNVASAAKNLNEKDSQFSNSVMNATKNVLKTVASAVKSFNAKNAPFKNGVKNNTIGAIKFVQDVAGAAKKKILDSYKRN